MEFLYKRPFHQLVGEVYRPVHCQGGHNQDRCPRTCNVRGPLWTPMVQYSRVIRSGRQGALPGRLNLSNGHFGAHVIFRSKFALRCISIDVVKALHTLKWGAHRKADFQVDFTTWLSLTEMIGLAQHPLAFITGGTDHTPTNKSGLLSLYVMEFLESSHASGYSNS